ncbi:MAG TPA: alpha/beta hydrolase-fold protein [Rubrivivax sp.]|jgi:polyhydroxybutyrate depolymerase|nr:alpha/beta hydrolase-fold protein [Rubrivivax sp.]
MNLRLSIALLCVAFSSGARTQPVTTQESATPAPTLRERIAAKRAERQAGRTPGNRPIGKPGTYDFTMEHDGETRMYRVHVPQSYSPARPTPVVFSFHGGGGSADIMSQDKYYGLVTKSEQAGTIAVFPNGYSRFRDGKLATFNAGICCGNARDKNVDDVGFVRKIVSRLKEQLNVDPDRISANGMSNGAMMSYRLACEAAEIFHSIAAVAGTDGMETCKPSRPVNVLHIHARNDELVLFNGGAGKDSKTLANFRSVNDTVARWVKLNGCNATPRRVLDRPREVVCESYGGCTGGVEVKACITETGGHSWPGGVKVRTGERGSTAFNANDMMWDFYERR